MTVVVDTNVILVANRQHQGVSEACVAACATRLDALTRGGCIAIDDRYRILKEYQNKTDPHAGKRAGDAFLKWLLRNNANPQHCTQVPLVEHEKRGFESFPDDPGLANFDAPDRKFVAVAAAAVGKPPILQAADSKWLAWEEGLSAHGVRVEFQCPKDIKKFEIKKRKHKGKGR